MASDEFFLDAEGAADSADFVLEEHLERLDDLEVHLLRQTAYVVVGLDLGGDACDAGGLDDIRIYGALGKPAGVFNGLCVFVECLHEETSYNLSLCLRLSHSCELFQELGRCVGSDDIQTHVLI